MTLDPDQLNIEAAAIAAIIAAADPNARVYDHQKLPTGNDWAPFIEAFTDATGTLNAWTLQYLGERRVPKTIAYGSTKMMREVRWRARKHLSWGDVAGSELTLRTSLRTVALALDADMGFAGTAHHHDPCDIDLLEGAGVSLGGFVCHYAELDFTAYVYETVATH